MVVGRVACRGKGVKDEDWQTIVRSVIGLEGGYYEETERERRKGKEE